jgi:hypothetical protein
MACGHSPGNPWRDKPRECSQLCCHEILNGPLRQKTLDKPSSLLVLCWWCNQQMNDKQLWPETRQLALLQARSPDDYDLVAHNELANPRAPLRVTQEEVDSESPARR